MLPSHISRETGPKMSNQLGEMVPPETAQAWDSVRRVREPVAWALLVLTAIIVLVSACQLFDLGGAQVPGIISPASASAFALRASEVAGQFFLAIVIAPPVIAVVLVTFCGGLTEHARQAVQTAAVVQAVTVGLGVISLAGAAASHMLPGTWFFLAVPELAIAATALVFTGAVLWSRELRSLAPRFQILGDEDEDFDGDSALGEPD
jgi:hypothetical protein